MDLSYIITMAIAGFLALLFQIFILKLRKDRARRDVKSGELILEYGRGFRILMSVTSLILPALILIMMIIQSKGFQDLEPLKELVEKWHIFAILLFFTVGIPMPVLMELWGVAHRISKEGIQKGSPWSKDFFLRWGDIRSITYSGLPEWLVIDSSGGTIRISIYLNGLGDLALAIQENVPEWKWSKVKEQLLLMD